MTSIEVELSPLSYLPIMTRGKQLEKILNMDVDISIIKKGGKFDNGAQIPIN